MALGFTDSARAEVAIKDIAGDPKRAAEAAALIQTALDTEFLTAAMDNVLAWRLGEICNQAARDPNVGDYIDRGLILRRLLEEKGFRLVYREPAPGGFVKATAPDL